MIPKRSANGSSESDASGTDSVTAATNQRSDTTDAASGQSTEPTRSRSDSDTCSSDGSPPDEADRFVLVPMNEYQPGMTGRVVDRLPAPTTVELLALPNGDTVSVLTQPDEYVGYVVRSTLTETQVRSTMIVFTRESLESGTRYVFEVGAQLFSTQLSLLRTTARRVESADSESAADDE